MNEEKLAINLPCLERKAESFTTHEYIVEKALPVSNFRFRQITESPMKDHKEIRDKAFAKTSRTAQKERCNIVNKLIYIFCFINIYSLKLSRYSNL